MRTLIIDTGSNVSILQPGISGSDVMVTNMKPYGVTGKELDIKGRQSVTFEFGGHEFRHTFLVCSLPTDAAGLLGTDFMEGTGAVINFEGGKMSLTDVAATPRARVKPLNSRAVLTVFTRDKEGRSPQPSRGKRQQVDKHSLVSSTCEMATSQNGVWLVKTRENITIEPRCRQVIAGKIGSKKETNPPFFGLYRASADPYRRSLCSTRAR